MELARLCHSSSALLASTTTTTLLPPNNKTRRFRNKNLIINSAKRPSSSDSSPSSVDESMVVLRKRIHEMKVIERNYEPPEDWAEWEKQSYARYGEFVCGFVGAVQSILLRSRPSLALAMIAIVAISVPAWAFALALRFIELANGAFSSLHLG